MAKSFEIQIRNTRVKFTLRGGSAAAGAVGAGAVGGRPGNYQSFGGGGPEHPPSFGGGPGNYPQYGTGTPARECCTSGSCAPVVVGPIVVNGCCESGCCESGCCESACGESACGESACGCGRQYGGDGPENVPNFGGGPENAPRFGGGPENVPRYGTGDANCGVLRSGGRWSGRDQRLLLRSRHHAVNRASVTDSVGEGGGAQSAGQSHFSQPDRKARGSTVHHAAAAPDQLVLGRCCRGDLQFPRRSNDFGVEAGIDRDLRDADGASLWAQRVARLQ